MNVQLKDIECKHNFLWNFSCSKHSTSKKMLHVVALIALIAGSILTLGIPLIIYEIYRISSSQLNKRIENRQESVAIHHQVDLEKLKAREVKLERDEVALKQRQAVLLTQESEFKKEEAVFLQRQVEKASLYETSRERIENRQESVAIHHQVDLEKLKAREVKLERDEAALKQRQAVLLTQESEFKKEEAVFLQRQVEKASLYETSRDRSTGNKESELKQKEAELLRKEAEIKKKEEQLSKDIQKTRQNPSSFEPKDDQNIKTASMSLSEIRQKLEEKDIYAYGLKIQYESIQRNTLAFLLNQAVPSGNYLSVLLTTTRSITSTTIKNSYDYLEAQLRGKEVGGNVDWLFTKEQIKSNSLPINLLILLADGLDGSAQGIVVNSYNKEYNLLCVDISDKNNYKIIPSLEG